jgi:hypothetical protein
LVLSGVLLLGGLSGCSQESPHEAVARELISFREELVDLLATVKDRASMDAALVKLKQLEPRAEALSRKAKALPPPSSEVRERLQERFVARMGELQGKIQDEIRRIRELPGGETFFEQLKIVLGGNGS